LIQLDLKQKGFFQEFPRELGFECVLTFKVKGAERECISPLQSVEVDGEFIKVTNYLSDYRYKYRIKDLRSAFILFKPLPK